MAFMIPYYTDESFVVVENKHGESRLVPAEYAGDIDSDETVTERYDGKWFCHLTAPGYVDQTDWDGPFDTEEEARDHIRDTYDVDPDTGDDLEDDKTA